MAHTAAYTLVTRGCPELHQELEDAIRRYMSTSREVNSSTAGRTIPPQLQRYQEWEEVTGTESSSVFGEILRDVAKADGWKRKPGSGPTVYIRPR